MPPPVVLSVFGPPCAGKSTFIGALSTELDFRPLGVGNELRLLARSDDIHAAEAAQLLAAGSPMPPWLSSYVMVRAMRPLWPSSVALDNFPRTNEQLEQLPEILVTCGYNRASCCGVVIELEEAEALRRLADRGSCTTCGFLGSIAAVKCPHCGLPLEARADDRDTETVRRRFEIFRRMTEPVIAAFSRSRPLLTISGRASMAEQIARVSEWMRSADTRI